MPELPEVETIRLGLQKHLVGQTIENVEIRLKKMVHGDPELIIGAKVKSVDRFGKGLVIELSNGYAIAAHIKMTGQFIYQDSTTVKKVHLSTSRIGIALPNKWTHVIFKLKNNEAYLYYNDVRQFGWIKILKQDEVRQLPFFKELGPEPPVTTTSNNNLTLQQFKNIISMANLPIKVLLLDQKRLSGVGNIYANDALFDARIDPRRKAKSLSQKEVNNLYHSIIKVLKKGLKYGGATELNFVNALGEEGQYQKHFLVYGRGGEKCKVCGGKIEKIRLGGRGTYFCPHCQK